MKARYRQLINEGCHFLFGPFSSTLTIPASGIADENGVIMIVTAGASPEIYQQGYEYIFGTEPLSPKWVSWDTDIHY